MSDEKIDFNEDPVGMLKQVIKTPSTMATAGLALGLGSEAAIVWNTKEKKPFSLKSSLIIGACAGGVGFIGSTLINAADQTKPNIKTDWTTRVIENESKETTNHR